MDFFRKLLNEMDDIEQGLPADHLEKEKKVKLKAGFLPYFIDHDGTVKFLLFKSSDPAYGGGDFAIGKGGVKPGEDVFKCAVREASEELGLKPSNLISNTVKLCWRGQMTGLVGTYEMVVYMGQVKNPKDFNQPHYETGELRWMTAEEFNSVGRSTHHVIVAAAIKALGK